MNRDYKINMRHCRHDNLRASLLLYLLHFTQTGSQSLNSLLLRLQNIAAVGIHDPDLFASSLPVGPEDNLSAIGRPTGVLVPLPLIKSQLAQIAAIGVDNV